MLTSEQVQEAVLRTLLLRYPALGDAEEENRQGLPEFFLQKLREAGWHRGNPKIGMVQQAAWETVLRTDSWLKRDDLRDEIAEFVVAFYRALKEIAPSVIPPECVVHPILPLDEYRYEEPEDLRWGVIGVVIGIFIIAALVAVILFVEQR